jgi:hypothetical protein
MRMHLVVRRVESFCVLWRSHGPRIIAGLRSWAYLWLIDYALYVRTNALLRFSFRVRMFTGLVIEWPLPDDLSLRLHSAIALNLQELLSRLLFHGVARAQVYLAWGDCPSSIIARVRI